MVKQGRLRLRSIVFFVLVILVATLLSACFGNTSTGNPSANQTGYSLPDWWRPCLKHDNNGNCTTWDMTKNPAHCDSINNPEANPNPLLTWQGIEVCTSLPGKSNLVGVNFSYPATSQENEFQCTELVKRYLYLSSNGRFASIGGTNGDQVVDNYTAMYSQLHRVVNDGTVQMFPAAGDVLSYAPASNPNGHTSIVVDDKITDATNGIGSITVIQQNITWSGTAVPTETLSVNGWMIQDSTHGAGSVISWMTPRSLQEVLGTSTQAASTPTLVPAPIPTPTQPPTATPVPTDTPIPTPTPTDTPTPTPTPTDTPTPTPVMLNSGTWQDPYGGANYNGDSVNLTISVQGSTVTGTMTGNLANVTVPCSGTTGPLSSFSSQDQGFLNNVIQNYGSGTGVFLVVTISADFEGVGTSGSTYYMVLQNDGRLQGFWYMPNQSVDAGALTFNRIS